MASFTTGFRRVRDAGNALLGRKQADFSAAGWFEAGGLYGLSGGLSGGMLQYGNGYLARLKIQDPATHSVTLACLRLLVATIETVRFGVVRVGAPPDAELDYDHPAAAALITPGGHVSRREVLWSVIEGLLIAGNAVLIPRGASEGGGVIPVDWRNLRLPDLLGDYRYEVRYPMRADTRIYPANQVAHFRHHLSRDGWNGMGLFPSNVLNELLTDATAQQYTLTMLNNLGSPGMIFMPAKDAEDDDYAQEDADALMRQVNESFTGRRRGSTMAIGKRWEMMERSGSLANRINLADIRNVSEERMLSILGVPGALVSIGTGVQQSAVGSTMLAHRRQFAAGTLQPLSVLLAEQFTTHLLPFYSPPGKFAFRCNYEECVPVREMMMQLDLEQAQLQQAIDAEALGENAVVPGSS